jgi:hypothetical protein
MTLLNETHHRREVVVAVFCAVTVAAAVTSFASSCIRKPVHRSCSKRRTRHSFEFVTRYLSEQEFVRSFRLPYQAFYALLQQLQPLLYRNALQPARSSGGVVEPAVRLGLTLYILAGASYLDMVIVFRVARSTAFEIFHITVDAISCTLECKLVSDLSRLQALAQGLCLSRTPASPLYGCVGALDGIDIAVVKPLDRFVPRNFYCRKGSYALPVQAIVDHSYRLLYMSAKLVGSTYDSLAFACSNRWQAAPAT